MLAGSILDGRAKRQVTINVEVARLSRSLPRPFSFSFSLSLSLSRAINLSTAVCHDVVLWLPGPEIVRRVVFLDPSGSHDEIHGEESRTRDIRGSESEPRKILPEVRSRAWFLLS